MKGIIVLVMLCASSALAADTFEASSTKIAMSVYGDCSASEDFYLCLKKKAVMFLDRLGRSENFSISDSVKVVRDANATVPAEEITGAKIDEVLARSADGKNAVLSQMLFSKINEFLGSRTIEISLPRAFSDDDEDDLNEEARFGDGGKKKKKKGGKKKGGGMGGILMLVAAKAMLIKSLLIAGLFVLVKKALIISKIALVLSGIIAIKKLLSAKSKHGGVETTHVIADHGGYSAGHGGSYVSGGGGHSDGHGGGHYEGWSSGGHGGGGGGWGRMIDDAQNLAYNAYSPKQ